MSIKDQALLVSVETSAPKKTKMDKEASEQIAVMKNADSKSTRVVNDLYPKHLMKPIEKAEGRARTLLQSGPTYMWKRNQFLLPSTHFMEFAAEAGKIELEHQQAVTAFMNNFTNVMLEAQATLGQMFDASVYPDLDELRESFTLKFDYDPVTDNKDFRVQMGEEAEAELRRVTQERTLHKFKGLADRVRGRLSTRIKNLISAMEKPEREIRDKDTNQLKEMASPIFKNSTFELLLEECDLITDFSDEVMLPEHCALACKIRQELPPPDSARRDKSMRESLAQKAKGWLAEIEGSTFPALPVDDGLAAQEAKVWLAELEPEYNESVDYAVNDTLTEEPEPDEEPEPTTLQDDHAIPPNPSAALMADIDAMFADDL